MLNKEKFKDDIFEIACNGDSLAINTHTNKLCACGYLICKDCKFNSSDNNDSCSDICKAWCNAEYKEPELDWSKVPIDTPIYIRQTRSWLPRYFAGEYNDYGVYHFRDGKTSFTSEDLGCTSYISFDNVKLAREEDIEKYIK